MSNVDQKNNIIDQLTENLEPVKRIPSTGSRFVLWLFIAATFITIPFLLNGSFRANSFEQFLGSAHFQIELFLGVSFICLAGFFALHISVPGRNLKPAQLMLLTIPMLLLIALTAYGIANPPFEITMAGKRAECVIEVFLYGLLPFIALLWIARKATPLQHRWSGLLIALAAFLPVGLIMQFACVYDPLHALKFHYAPVVVMGIIGGAIGRVLKNI